MKKLTLLLLLFGAIDAYSQGGAIDFKIHFTETSKTNGGKNDSTKSNPDSLIKSSDIDTPKKVETDDISIKVRNSLLEISTIKFSKKEDDSYLIVLTDSFGNSLSSFSLGNKLNEASFYDNLTDALKEIASPNSKDTNVFNPVLRTVIKQFKDEDFFKKFLLKIAELDNTNTLAGTLTINKKIYIHTSENIASGSKKARSEKPRKIKDYSEIKSIKEAKKVADMSIKEAERLSKDLENLVSEDSNYLKNATSKTDTEYINKVKALSGNIKNQLASAKRYVDSINNKIPDYKILSYYLKAIEISRQVQEAINRAKLSINDTLLYLNDTTKKNQGIKSVVQAETNALKLSLTKFTVQEIQIQFEDGFIENIKIFGKKENDQHLYRYENYLPIAFSTRRDFRNLIDIELYEKSDYNTYKSDRLILGELISYNQNLANGNKDYSPANQVLTIKNISKNTKVVDLYKDQTTKLLELKVFSDLKGTNDNNPNGLIQVEISRRLNFWSNRKPFSSKIYHPLHWFGKKYYDNLGNCGFFNYVTPQLTLSKIEDNQKYLVLNHVNNLSLAADSSKPISYSSSINLLRHQIFSVGMDLSIFLIDIPGLKSTFNFGYGFYFGRSAVQDSLYTRKDSSNYYSFSPSVSNNVLQYYVNTFQSGPYITWQIFPDSRYGLSVTQRLSYFKALTDNFVQVRDSSHYQNFVAGVNRFNVRNAPYNYYDYKGGTINDLFHSFSLFTKCLASTEIYAFFNPNSSGDNKLFFRYRLNWDLTNAHENFSQIQVGFSTYLSHTKAYSKLKKASGFDD